MRATLIYRAGDVRVEDVPGIEELMPDVLDGTLQSGRVFDRALNLDDVRDGYRAMPVEWR
jgi:hypothetical protein